MQRALETAAGARYLLAAARAALGLAALGLVPLLSEMPSQDCAAEEVSAARSAGRGGGARAVEPAAPLFIESDANTPARLTPEPLPSAQPISPRPLMCCRPAPSAAPPNAHPTLLALASAVKPRGRQAMAASPELPELPPPRGSNELEGPAAIEQPRDSSPAPPKLISNPWVQGESDQPSERQQWRTLPSRPVRLAEFNQPPPYPQPTPNAQPSAKPTPNDLPSLSIHDRATINAPVDERSAGENPLRGLDVNSAPRPGRWSGPNPLR